MADDTSTLGKVFIGIFILEVIGIIFTLTFTPTTQPILNGTNTINNQTTIGFYSSSTSFGGFISSINGTTKNIATAFASCSISSFNCTAPLGQQPYLPKDENYGLNNIANALTWVGNQIITLLDLIILGIWLFINLIILMMLMIGLLGYIFVVFLPMVLVSAGPIGFILTLGYVFIIALAGYKYGGILIQYVGAIFGAVIKAL